MALAYCTGEGAGPTGPRDGVPSAARAPRQVGTVYIAAATSGADVDPDGYTVTLDSASGKTATQTIGVNATLKYPNVNAGTRTATLAGLAGNCSTTANPRTFELAAGATVTVTFAVTCQATTGSLTTTVTTTGADPDPDGYTVTIDGGVASQPVGPNGSVTFASLGAGTHTLELTGLAANCTTPDSPQTVSITAGGTTSATIGVTCQALATTGSIEVTAATTGADPDPDGYTVTVDDGEGQAIASNGAVSFAGLPAGEHTVTLAAASVAGNCTVTSANPQTVSVTAGQSAVAAFTVSCAAVPTTGSLRLTTTTTGADPDPDGYVATVDDGAASQPVGANGVTTFEGLGAGTHTVALSGIAANCATADSPQTVTVVAGGTVDVAMSVACQAIVTTGSLTVTTATGGSDLDPDGYTVSVDGGSPSAIGVNGSVTFANLSAGSHTVTLAGLAANCTTADSPQTVSVTTGATASASFAVTCAAIPTTGDLSVAVTTTGADLDADGYTLTLDGGAASRAVAANGTVTFTGLAAGTHSVALSGLATNCAVSGQNPQTVSITAGAATQAAFAVSCAAIPTTGDLGVSATTTGSDLDADGYTVTVDGGAAQALAINGAVTFADLGAGPHGVQLSGLAANCTTTNNPRTVDVPAGGTTSTTFAVTCAPIPTAAFTLVGAADIASCSYTDDEATAKVLDAVVAADAAATVFTVGDNVYEGGQAIEYANCYHPTWGRHKARTRPALGNHDYQSVKDVGDATPSFDYFGDALGPRGLGYYSYDLGDWHVIVMNDNAYYGGPGFWSGSTQDKWLQADLAASTKRCTVAIWHQPYLATGVNDASRRWVWDRLFAAGVEIVINGHKRRYERLAPQTPDGVRDDARGMRTFIVGTGGNATSLASPLHPNTEVMSAAKGVLKLTLGAGTYRWDFLSIAGQTFTDSGTGTCH